MKMTEQFPRLAVGLVHYPIVDREKKIVATNITNFDIHDIARAATVFGVEKYFIIHPMRDQLSFVERVLDHWRVGQGSKFNPYRRTALNDVVTCETVEQAKSSWGIDCITLVTHARSMEGMPFWTCTALRQEIRKPGKACLLLFGTGFGMTDSFMQGCDGILESIRGAPPKDYRHLSVRSAVSIYLDRIMGPW